MEENVYILSPMVALHLAGLLEVHARNAIAKQQTALMKFEKRPK